MQIAGDSFPLSDSSKGLDLLMCHAQLAVRPLLLREEDVAAADYRDEKKCRGQTPETEVLVSLMQQPALRHNQQGFDDEADEYRSRRLNYEGQQGGAIDEEGYCAAVDRICDGTQQEHTRNARHPQFKPFELKQAHIQCNKDRSERETL